MAAKKVKALSVKEIKEKMTRLKGERSNWESHWQEVADHILPRKNTVIRKQADGQKRQFILLDNVGMHSNELLAGALHGLLTNPNSLWFEMTTGVVDLDNVDEVRKWLQKTARSMHNVLNNSNFQMEVHELYIDLCSFGTSCMQFQEDKETIVRFSTKFIADYYVVENERGVIDQVYREWKLTAVELCSEFGIKNLPKKVQDAYEKRPDEKFCIVHAVYPRVVAGEKLYKGESKYVSQYILPDCDHEISVGTFKDFPYLVPRWTKAAGESYGRSPGMNALPELKVLNKMNETMLIGAQKKVDPPLQMEDDGVVLPIMSIPGGLNYRRPGSEPIQPLFADTNMDFGYQAMEDRRKRVRDAYFVDQLQLQANGPMMTATEVLQRTEERMRLLGPMLGRQQSEFLRPLIDRLFNLMWERGLIEPPPAALQGRSLDVRYSSLIAKSQRLDEGQAIMRTMQAVAPFGQIDPGVWDNFDGDMAARVVAGVYGFPQEIIRNMRQVEKIRSDRQAAIQAQVDREQSAQNMQGVETMTKTLQNTGV